MGSKCYAVGNANGYISVGIEGETKAAQEWFRDQDHSGFVDACRTDAEDELGFDGNQLTPEEFADAMRSNGYEIVDPNMLADHNWVLWAHKERGHRGYSKGRTI